MMKHLKLMINSPVFIKYLAVFILIFNITCTGAQDCTDLDTEYPVILLSDTVCLQPIDSSSKLIKDEYTIIEDSGRVLNTFFKNLMDMKKGVGDSVVSILHIGDSHVQAGDLSGKTMRLLQQEFGNAGRGWIEPLKIAKTNEPNDYFLTSSIKDWKHSRLGRRNNQVPLGLGSVAISTNRETVDFNLMIAPNNGKGYSFSRLDVFRYKEALPLTAIVGNAQLKQGVLQEGYTAVCDTILLPSLMDAIQLRAVASSSTSHNQQNNLYYGFVLRNEKRGILYHSIGANGAMFTNYTNPQIIQGMTLLKPNLIIISLGTNETSGRNFNKAEFKGQVEALVDMIKVYFPDIPILLTTPPEVYKRIGRRNNRRYVVNKNSYIATTAIKEVAKEKNLACFDLFSAAGGKGSAGIWFNHKWLRRDRIHFSIEGYENQGSMLYSSLMKSWNDYVKGLLDKQKIVLETPIIQSNKKGKTN